MAQSDRLFLEDTCATLQQKLERGFVQGKEVPEQDFQDFEVNYWVSSDAEKLQLIVRYPYLQQVLSNGSQALLETMWAGLPLGLKVESGQLDVTVQHESLGEDQELRENVAKQLLLTHNYLLMGPLVQQLRWLRDATTSGTRNTTAAATSAVPAPMSLQVRQLESCWIFCKADRVVVVFTLHVDDEKDVALGRAFCQEFAETGRGAKALPCSFSPPNQPPSDIPGAQLAFVPNVGYISLTLSDQCVRGATEERLQALAQPVMTFRNFFNFHVKNAKSYLHSRLRKRIDAWQQIMKSARRAPRKGQDVKRRTIGGKVFVEKAGFSPPARA